jgi:predicted acetyltransferase
VTLEIMLASDANRSLVGKMARCYVAEVATRAGCTISTEALLDCVDLLADYWGLDPAAGAWPPAWRGFPFLLWVDGRPGGFALVKRLRAAPATFDMGEFFVVRSYRRRGIGRFAATWLFDGFAGAWEVRQMPTNAPAQRFWRRVIADYTGGAFTETRETFAAYDAREFVVQRFATPRASSQAVPGGVISPATLLRHSRGVPPNRLRNALLKCDRSLKPQR